MNDRTRSRASWLRPSLALAFTLTLFGTAALAGCHDAKKDQASAPDAAASAAIAPVAAPVTAAPSASAAPAPEPELEEVPDSGTDGGVRKRKRLVAAGADGGGATVETTAAAAPAPSAEPSSGRSGKRPPTPMDNDQVYGASAASAAPVLKKKPLPDDNPYAK